MLIEVNLQHSTHHCWTQAAVNRLKGERGSKGPSDSVNSVCYHKLFTPECYFHKLMLNMCNGQLATEKKLSVFLFFSLSFFSIWLSSVNPDPHWSTDVFKINSAAVCLSAIILTVQVCLGKKAQLIWHEVIICSFRKKWEKILSMYIDWIALWQKDFLGFSLRASITWYVRTFL